MMPRRLIMNKATNQTLIASQGTQRYSQEQGSLKGEHLHALMFKLRAQSAGELLPHAGQLVHAALLHWVEEVDATLATRLHEPNMRRPFTCSSLWFPEGGESVGDQQANRRLVIMPNHIYWLRFTLLTESLFRTLITRFFQMSSPALEVHGGLDLPKLRLGTVHFDVVEVTTAPSEVEYEKVRRWSGHATYSD